MKANHLCLLILVLLASLTACGSVETASPATSTPLPTATQAATAPPPPTELPPTPTAPLLPAFSPNLRFTSAPNQPEQRIFPALTWQVYALWDYENMSEGLVVRREWYRNGELWLQRETPWDFARYGAKGTVTDISIYDFDSGLESGVYQLRLYIDGTPQFVLEAAAGQIEFIIEKDKGLVDVISPDGKLHALITEPSSLKIQNESGTIINVFSVKEAYRPAWFPDNVHLVFSSIDRSKQDHPPSTIGVRHELLLANAKTGELRQLTSLDENLHSAIVSPNGRTLALLKGDDWGDACFVNRELVFMELDENYQPGHITNLKDFAGITETDDSIYPPMDWQYKNSNSGWQNATQFKAPINWACALQNTPSGIYVFDIKTFSAERVGDLPPQ